MSSIPGILWNIRSAFPQFELQVFPRNCAAFGKYRFGFPLYFPCFPHHFPQDVEKSAGFLFAQLEKLETTFHKKSTFCVKNSKIPDFPTNFSTAVSTDC